MDLDRLMAVREGSAGSSPDTPRLILGPMLRYVSGTEATIWVEIDRPGEVKVLGRTARTFSVGDHHYALVCLTELQPGGRYEYDVCLDGHVIWPESGSQVPLSVIHTVPAEGPVRVRFGSCLVTAPHEPPYTLPWSEHPKGLGIDALRTLALELETAMPDEWPHVLLLMGDQVYADEVSPTTRAFIRSRRDVTVPPYEGVADFEEYTHAYLEAWRDPAVRWLLSTVSTAMIFDDHEVQDDWNISESWVDEIRREPWWNERIVSALMSYWVYQHIGNLGPDELAADDVYQEVLATEGDASEVLRRFAFRADRQNETCRWSYTRDLGMTRLVVIDSRASRLLLNGRREMVDDVEWAWLEEVTAGGCDHLLMATSLPYLLFPSVHALQAWNEAVCDGAWGPLAARVGERIRRAVDLEHWAAFGESFDRLARLIRSVGAGERGRAPASIIILSGDVHYTSLARVRFRRHSRVTSRVYQVVCSPLRHPLRRRERRAHRLSAMRPGEWIGRLLARSAGVERPIIRWKTLMGPTFDNNLGTLELRGREARLRIERAVDGEGASGLELTEERVLSDERVAGRRRRRRRLGRWLARRAGSRG
ncbi:alkaline phosphatase D family protein [soil metagenome]